LLNSNVSPTCPHNMVNFGPLAAEICWRVCGTRLMSTGFAFWQRYCTRHSSSGRQPNFAALNRGRHLYSAGRPSRWALAHILVYYYSPNYLNCRRSKRKKRQAKCGSSPICRLEFSLADVCSVFVPFKEKLQEAQIYLAMKRKTDDHAVLMPK